MFGPWQEPGIFLCFKVSRRFLGSKRPPIL